MKADPDFQDILAALDISLIAELERNWKLETLPDVALAAAYLDSILRDKALQVLVRNGHLIWPNAQTFPDRDVLQIEDAIYEIRVAESILQFDILEIAVVPRGITEDAIASFRSESLTLEGGGRYKTIKWHIPNQIVMEQSRAFALVTEIFGIGYRWFKEALLQMVSQHQKQLADDLYGLLRTLVPNTELMDGVWFAVGATEGGFYLLDVRATESAFNILGRSRAPLAEAPSRLLAEFVSALFPEEQTFASRAIREKLSLLVADIPKGSYAEKLSMVSEAEMAIYGSNIAIVYPIVATGMPYLVAVFPKEKRDSLVPFLEQHKEVFAEKFLRSRDRLKHFIKSLTSPRRHLEVGKVGELIGGILKSYTDV